MRPRPVHKYEIISIRPEASEFLVKFIEDDLSVTLNLRPPLKARDLHIHIMRSWPKDHFRGVRAMRQLVAKGFQSTVDVSPFEAEKYGLVEADE